MQIFTACGIRWQCIIKQLLDEVFVICGIINVEVRVTTLTSTLIIPHITKTSPNNCLLTSSSTSCCAVINMRYLCNYVIMKFASQSDALGTVGFLSTHASVVPLPHAEQYTLTNSLFLFSSKEPRNSTKCKQISPYGLNYNK